MNDAMKAPALLLYGEVLQVTTSKNMIIQHYSVEKNERIKC